MVVAFDSFGGGGGGGSGYSESGAKSGAATGGGIGSLVGNIANIFGAGGRDGSREREKALEILLKINTPEFDYRDLSAPELEILAEFSPETYEAVIPDEAKLPDFPGEGRGAQLAASNYYTDLMQGGVPELQRLQEQEALDSSLGARLRGDEAVDLEAARHGVTGEGVYRARQGMDQRNIGLDESLGAQKLRSQITQKLAGAQGAASTGAQLQSQDSSNALAEANIVNRFNEYSTGRQTDAARYAASQRQGTSDMNVGRQQHVGDQNVLNQYLTNESNLNRGNELLDMDFENRFDLGKAQANQYNYMGGARDQKKAAKEAAYGGLVSDIGGIGGSFIGGGLLG